MGHHTGCVEIKYVHGRESYEVLFVILKKRTKVTFSGHTNIQSKRPRLDTIGENQPEAKETHSNLLLPSLVTDSLSMLADTALNSTNTTQSHTLPNSLPELVEDVLTTHVIMKMMKKCQLWKMQTKLYKI